MRPLLLLGAACAATCVAQGEPALPQACNVTEADDPMIYGPDMHFRDQNRGCWETFRTCMSNGVGPCNSDCNAAVGDLNDACYAAADASFCSVYGRNDDSKNGIVYDFKSNDCLPASCDDSYNGAMLSVWKARVCGALWNSSQCSIQLDCDYQNDVTSRTWLIVGSVCGAAGFVLVLCATAYCFMRRKELLEDEELFEELDEGGDHDVLDVAAGAAAYGFINPAGTQGGAGEEADRGLLDAEDPVPYTYAQMPRPQPDRDPQGR